MCTVRVWLWLCRDVITPANALRVLREEPAPRYDNLVAGSVALGARANVAAATMVGADCVLGERASVKRSVVGQGCHLGAGTKVSGRHPWGWLCGGGERGGPAWGREGKCVTASHFVTETHARWLTTTLRFCCCHAALPRPPATPPCAGGEQRADGRRAAGRQLRAARLHHRQRVRAGRGRAAARLPGRSRLLAAGGHGAHRRGAAAGTASRRGPRPGGVGLQCTRACKPAPVVPVTP